MSFPKLHPATKFPQSEILPLPNDVDALANRINSATRSAHNKIDRSVSTKFVVALRDGKIYRQGLQAFYHVFKNAEIEINRLMNDKESGKAGEILREFWNPTFARTEALEKDLLYFYNNQREKFENPIREEQIEFAQHIHQVCQEKPHLILAYCHVMYLALFAGGRLMKSSLSKATGIFPTLPGQTIEDVSKNGTHLFKFDCDDDESLRLSYKRDYELATRLKLTELEKLEIIEESKYIFDQNFKMIEELEIYNRQKITGKLSYKVLNYGYYVAVVVLILLTLLFGRRVASYFF
ncbi:hypothetical protein WICPIJ_009928 [Wickerhamomyces pijperi]|uniref:Heme oxygenase n=1 Tax=Wickerhamomyces pijperi TaxID=599730 RepID=A0A9P8PJM6_WICPI|nr:hypothetical protein WICPIJ_009928 [Wickerhamomyces pijperi]